MSSANRDSQATEHHRSKHWWQSYRAFSAPGPGGNVLLWTKNLTFEDPRTRARLLSALTLGFRQKTITAIVDPTGAHSRALLLLLAGLENPTSGSVRTRRTHNRHFGRSQSAPAITWVDSSTPFNPSLTVKQNLIASLATIGLITDEDAFTEALQLTGTSAFLDSSPAELKDFDRLRLRFAQGLICGAELFIIDDSVDSLPTSERSKLLALCQDIASLGGAIIYATRSPLLLEGAHRAVLLVNGEVTLDQAPPRTVFIKEHLESTPLQPSTFLGPIPSAQPSSPTEDAPQGTQSVASLEARGELPSAPSLPPTSVGRPFRFPKVHPDASTDNDTSSPVVSEHAEPDISLNSESAAGRNSDTAEHAQTDSTTISHLPDIPDTSSSALPSQARDLLRSSAAAALSHNHPQRTPESSYPADFTAYTAGQHPPQVNDKEILNDANTTHADAPSHVGFEEITHLESPRIDVTEVDGAQLTRSYPTHTELPQSTTPEALTDPASHNSRSNISPIKTASPVLDTLPAENSAGDEETTPSSDPTVNELSLAPLEPVTSSIPQVTGRMSSGNPQLDELVDQARKILSDLPGSVMPKE